ncbi:unnamed protein product [Cylindrotheca closterium]|uniref:Uncharacterized protein n=1 Tax=Cylindrotheca closterium TaxID=2856 RepID=A0AAD2CAV8_9STRA|nr:unnamed protein product [Cylindrotheca closterium]
MDSNNLPSVEKVKTTVPLTDLQAFDMMSRFLEAEKAKHLSLDIAGQSYLSTSSQIWNDLRLACNSLLEQNDHRREPVVEWKMDTDLLTSPPPAEPMLEESTPVVPESAKSSTSLDTSEKGSRRSASKDKKELKRAKKEEKKSAKKAKKEAKKAKKEAKKRKRESLST